MNFNELEFKSKSTPKSGFWNEKPFWCQPWSIVFTGIAILALSWITVHSLFITGLLTIFILIWWSLFLILAPSAYLKQAESIRDVDSA